MICINNILRRNLKSSQTPKSKQTFVLNKKKIRKKKKKFNGDQPGLVRYNTSLSLFLFDSPLKEREKKKVNWNFISNVFILHQKTYNIAINRERERQPLESLDSTITTISQKLEIIYKLINSLVLVSFRNKNIEEKEREQ